MPCEVREAVVADGRSIRDTVRSAFRNAGDLISQYLAYENDITDHNGVERVYRTRRRHTR